MKFFYAIIGLLFALGAQTYAQTSGPVVIEYDQSNYPFMYGAEGGARGIYPTLVGAVFSRMGVPLKQQTKPWARVELEAYAGTAGIGGLYKNSEREKTFDFSAPIFEEKLYLYTLPAKTFVFQDMNDLSGKSIGVIRGWSYGDAFDRARHAGAFAIQEASSDEENVQKLIRGRVDAIISTPQSLAPLFEKEALRDKVIAIEPAFLSNNTYIAFNKSAKKSDLLRQFNETLDAMKADGCYDASVNKGLDSKESAGNKVK